jgi:hypothetical protein
MDDFLAVVNYPSLEKNDYDWIEAYRKKNDDYASLIDVHFSLVFPIHDISPALFISEIRKQAAGCRPISFVVRAAIRSNDLTTDYWHVLLVPDEGFGAVVRLHDRLYSGSLASHERLDLDFIPHMGIGNSKDPKRCKRMVSEVNANELAIRGWINDLDIIQMKNGQISTLHRIPLT